MADKLASYLFKSNLPEIRNSFDVIRNHGQRIRRGHEKPVSPQNHVAILKIVTLNKFLFLRKQFSLQLCQYFESSNFSNFEKWHFNVLRFTPSPSKAAPKS